MDLFVDTVKVGLKARLFLETLLHPLTHIQVKYWTSVAIETFYLLPHLEFNLIL